MGGVLSAPALSGSWSGQDVTTAEVLSALDRLRRAEEHTATRTSVVNLVVASSDAPSAARAQSAMNRLGHHHPGRTVALVICPEAEDGVHARVDLHRARSGSGSIWWEEVRLSLGGRRCEHADSLVIPLLLADLPVVVWYPSALPARDDPLLASADAVLVDARWAGEDEEAAPVALPALVELGLRHPLVDLSWKRLTPWRELLADLFEAEPFRSMAGEAIRAEVAAHAGPALLLAGWLMDRLELPPAAVALGRATHASIRLLAGGASFEVTRLDDGPVVQARAAVEGGRERRRAATLPEHGLTWSLAEALSRLERDPVYDHALHAALALL